MSKTPAQIRHGGARKGQHNEDVLSGQLGLDAATLATLKDKGVI
jgi:crotonobetainyl-CoA:carnitine CoA-transferase CaiB-like acyl-CoA transferase